MAFKIIFILLFFFFSFVKNINAESDYVLPYPSFMPGSIFYRVNLIKDELLKYWYFGDFGQFKYNLKEADKYLVEAKTLFEYKQYLLGINSLRKSDSYFTKLMPNLIQAKTRGNPIEQNFSILKSASLKHIEVLEKLKAETPETFQWNPEKGEKSLLKIKKALNQSITVRTIE